MLAPRSSRRRVLLAAVLLLGACVGEHRDWAFVQSVGGMALGAPYRTAKGVVMLPVRVDVSGTKAITTKPTALNSGLGIREIRVRRDGNTVRLALVTTPARESATSAGEVALGNLEVGLYTVQYAEPNGHTVDLGAIRVEPSRLALEAALDGWTETGKWEGEQRISQPPPADLETLRERLAWVDRQVRTHCGGAALSGRLGDLDLLQRLIDAKAIDVHDTYALQSLGVALGFVLVDELGFHWVIVEDKYGRDPAVKFADTSVLAFPLTMIAKRVERGERPDVRGLVESLRNNLPTLVKRLDPEP